MEPDRQGGLDTDLDVSVDRPFRIVTLLASLILWIAITVVATELVEYNRNTLLRNGAWISSKPLMQMHLMGAHGFLVTRNALSRNRLNLGSWFGYNEVHFARPVEPLAIEARFRLDPGAYLDVILDRRESGRRGIRLSRDPRFPSEWYRAERAGRIVERSPVPVSPEDLADGWHRLMLRFSALGIGASLDRARPIALPFDGTGERFVGLGGGRAQVAVDRVRITGRSGEIVLDDMFRNRRGYGAIAAGVAAVGLLAVLLGARQVLARTGPALRFASYRWLTILIVALIVLTAGFAFDYGFWSTHYAYGPGRFLPGGARPPHLAILVETLRAGLFATGGAPIGTPTLDVALRPLPALRRSISAWDGSSPLPDSVLLLQGLTALTPEFLTDEEITRSPDKVAGTRRIAFLGTSQTRGTGAETLSETFVARVHARLAAALADTRLETYNLAVPGSQSSELLRRYRQSWSSIRPDLLVVNLSNNDRSPQVLAENLRALTDEVRRGGGRIVFVLEANSIERGLGWHRHMHEAVTALGHELNVPVWDLHGYLAGDDVFDSGRLWWDHVHLSSYGQDLTAGWLAPLMLPLVSEEAPLAVGADTQPRI